MTFRPLHAALSTLALACALPACAQPAEQDTPKPAPQAAAATQDADPALWVVKDKDTTIYLFGTIHVLKPGLTWFDDAVKTAFDRSGELVLELVQPDQKTAAAIVSAKAVNPDATPLSETLTPARRATLARTLTDNSLPVGAFDRMRPWFAAMSLTIIPLQKLGYDAEQGPETVLTAAAAKARKPVIGLETFEGQLGIFDRLSASAQRALLDSTIDELPKASETMGKMVSDWSHGDPDALAAEMNDDLKSSPEVGRLLLTDRNKAWATWIQKRMQRPGTVFIAVGAGHLAGPDSVQRQLAARGVKSVRMKY